MKTYTPGPWHVQQHAGMSSMKILIYHKLYPIALVFAKPYLHEDIANARLIAAAPELLDALTSLLDWAENQCGLSGNDECYGAFDSEEIVTASRLLERLKD